MSAINQIMVALKATPIEHGVFVGTNTYSSTWTVPFGITEITVEAIGAGDDGIRGSTGPGGGGGAYAKTSAISVTPGQTIYYRADTNLATPRYGSWVNVGSNAIPSSTSQGCYAKSALDAAAGTAAASIGNVTYSGGTGGAGAGFGGGGGGGAAGPNGEGKNGGGGNSTGYASGGGGGAGGASSTAGGDAGANLFGAGGNGPLGTGGGSTDGADGTPNTGGGGAGNDGGDTGFGGAGALYPVSGWGAYGPGGGGGGATYSGGDGGGRGAGGGGTRNETAGTTAGSGTYGVIVITY